MTLVIFIENLTGFNLNKINENYFRRREKMLLIIAFHVKIEFVYI